MKYSKLLKFFLHNQYFTTEISLYANYLDLQKFRNIANQSVCQWDKKLKGNFYTEDVDQYNSTIWILWILIENLDWLIHFFSFTAFLICWIPPLMITTRLTGYRIFYLGSPGLSRFLAAEKLTKHRQTSYGTGEIPGSTGLSVRRGI